MSIGILFAVTKAHPMLWNNGAQEVQHVTRHVWVSVFIHRQSGRGVLHIQHDHTFLFAGILQRLLYSIRNLDQFFALTGTNLEHLHHRIVAQTEDPSSAIETQMTVPRRHCLSES